MERGILVYVLIVTIAAAITLVLSDGGTKAELPTYNIGDEWVYRSTNDITYTFHYKVTAEETIDDEDSYVIETSYDPPFLGIKSGETTWVKKGTGDTMKEQWSGNYTGFLFTRTQTYSYQYSGADKWPIEVGKEYSVTRTQTYTITPPYQTGTETKTSTVKVEKMEDVTVPAGTFTCFKEVYYDEDGNVWFTLWHSDDVKRYVKTINNETGETTELVSYSIKEESLAISGPTGLEVGEEAMFTVTSRSSPVENAFVEVDGDTKKSGADGTVTLVFDQPGNFTVTTTKEGYEGASIPVTVTAHPEGAPHYEIVASVNWINDADTIEVGIYKLVAELDPGGEISEGTTERIRFGGGVDAPELTDYTPPRSGQPGSVEATEFIENLIPLRTTVYLDLNDLSVGGQTGRPYRGEYERLIAVIYTVIDGQWVNINAELLRWGLEEYPGFGWLKYRYYPSEWNPDDWLGENYPYVLD
ncbi:MAG: hypothetical protein E3J80_01930 [Hadesarchaea archaeon]|nr:MAG: hypothetical protein E3J80_01930 [Hadesarchaea archaeon]